MGKKLINDDSTKATYIMVKPDPGSYSAAQLNLKNRLYPKTKGR